MIVFPTWKDGRFVRPDLFLSARGAAAIGSLPESDELRGIRIIPLPAFDRLPSPIADHPDMLIYREPNGDLVVYEGYYAENRPLFDALPCKIRTIPDPKSVAYPDDVTLNCLNLRGRLIGRVGSAHPGDRHPGDNHPLLTSGLTPLPVKQGYARCSVCMVGPDAAITADRGIADALDSIGIRVLRIRPGLIRLDGYDCGFIGGASLSMGERIGFFGELSTHPDGGAMEQFIRRSGLKPIALCKGPLTDFGGGLWLDPV